MEKQWFVHIPDENKIIVEGAQLRVDADSISVLNKSNDVSAVFIQKDGLAVIAAGEPDSAIPPRHWLVKIPGGGRHEVIARALEVGATTLNFVQADGSFRAVVVKKPGLLAVEKEVAVGNL
jgi:hypothetical protein